MRVPSRAEEGGEFPWFVRKEVVVGVRFVQMAPPRGDRKRASGARASQIAEGIADVCGAGGVDAEPMTGKKDAVWCGLHPFDLVAADQCLYVLCDTCVGELKLGGGSSGAGEHGDGEPGRSQGLDRVKDSVVHARLREPGLEVGSG